MREQVSELEEFKYLIRVHRINITVSLELINNIAADIRPLQHSDGSDDVLAIEEYTDFIINVLGVFDEHDFEILDEHTSPYSHSYYYTLVKKSDAEAKKYRYILFIRLSDHFSRQESESAKKAYYAQKADAMKQPSTKSKQTWRLKEITVNRDTFDSYEEALQYVGSKLPN